jgi:hypothetical protein
MIDFVGEAHLSPVIGAAGYMKIQDYVPYVGLCVHYRSNLIGHSLIHLSGLQITMPTPR